MKVLKICRTGSQTTFDTHGFVFGKDSKFQVKEEEDKEKMRELWEENISFPFIL